MKLTGLVAVLAMTTAAWAGDNGQAQKRVVTVCLNPGANAAMFFRAEATATQILRQANVDLNWRDSTIPCTKDGNGIVFTFSQTTPANLHPGALAYALPFEGAHVVLFYDRVLTSVSSRLAPYLTGHVLAHEIVHILQRVDQHSDTGVMKAHWAHADFSDMQQGLKLTQWDINLIEDGMKQRGVKPYDQ
jgi:hypothetical protein